MAIELAQNGTQQAQGEPSPIDKAAYMVELKRRMDALPNPHVACNEYPNPPWNTIVYDWDTHYPENSPEHRAQCLAKFAQVSGLQYSTVDRYAQYRKKPRAGEEVTAPAIARPGKELPTVSITRAPIEIKNGVLTDTHLFCKHQGKLAKLPLAQAIQHAGDILQLCLDYELQTMWILAGTELSARGTQAFIDAARAGDTWGIKTAKFTRVRGRAGEFCTFLSAWKKQEARSEQESGRDLYIGYAEYATDWFLDEIEHPVTLLAVISYLEDALGVPVLFSTGNVGKQVMKEVNRKSERQAWVTPVGLNALTPIVTTKALLSAWKRPLTLEEQAMLWLLVYDKNSEYPASCTGVILGEGMPALIERPTFDMKRDKPLPGLWYCRISGESPFNGRELPHPTNGIGEGWFWSYTVKLLHEVGYTVEIEQAHVWREGHTVLRPFAEKIWEARASLQSDTERYTNAQAREIAQGDVKMIANKSLAWLDLLANRERENTEDSFDRPDWYQLLKDNARYQMFWRIRSYLEKGFSPVGMHEDCLYYVANDPRHETALPHFMERKNPKTKLWESSQNALGGFKRKYKNVDIPVSIACPLFNAPAMDIAAINTQFLAMNRQQEQGE